MDDDRAIWLTRAEFMRAMMGTLLVGFPLAAAAQTGRRIRGTPAAEVSATVGHPAPGIAHTSAVEHPLVPVKVSASRVIATTVGLRPYRRSGFLLKTEPFGAKTLVHNYGHGGGGMSLSWGCATLAADLVAGMSPSHAAVIGAGVIGLSTARILQDRGWQVTIYAEHLSPNTTSNMSGAQWTPASVCKHGAMSPEFRPVFDKAARIANRSFQILVGASYGVRWIDNYTLSDSDDDSDMIDYATQIGLADLYADVETIDPASTPFKCKRVRRFATMLIEPNTYLPAVMRDFLLRGGRFSVRKFENIAEWHHLHEKVIFNCTGLGARALLDDFELEPVRGQLTILEPQADVDYITMADSLYMFPRSDGILLGGTYEHGNWSLDPDMATQARILTEHVALYRS